VPPAPYGPTVALEDAETFQGGTAEAGSAKICTVSGYVSGYGF